MPQKFYPRPKVRAEETMDHRWKQSKGEAHFKRDAGQVKLLLENGYTKKEMALMYAVPVELVREMFS